MIKWIIIGAIVIVWICWLAYEINNAPTVDDDELYRKFIENEKRKIKETDK